MYLFCDESFLAPFEIKTRPTLIFLQVSEKLDGQAKLGFLHSQPMKKDMAVDLRIQIMLYIVEFPFYLYFVRRRMLFIIERIFDLSIDRLNCFKVAFEINEFVPESERATIG